MALAVLAYDGRVGAHERFRVDIGTNRLYGYAVGDGRHAETVDGFRVLGERTFESSLMGPLPPPALGRTVLEVPADLFAGDHRQIQLISFKEEHMSPALSAIVTVPGGSPALLDGPPSPAGFSLGLGTTQRVDVTGLWQPRQKVSTAMFLEALAGLLPQVLPIVGQLLQGVFPASPPAGGGSPPVPPPAGGSSAVVAPPAPPGGDSGLVALLERPDVQHLLQDVVRTLLGKAPPPAQAQSVRDAVAHELGVAPALSHSMFLPALLAVPGVMTLLQQVLTPQTVQAVVATADPNKLIATITAGLSELGKLALAGQQQQLTHLEHLNPGTTVDDVTNLLQGMGMSLSIPTQVPAPRSPNRRQARPVYTRVAGVHLVVADLTPQPLAGRPQVCFRTDTAWSIPLAVETPRPITKATLTVELRDATTLRTVYVHSDAVAMVGPGRLPDIQTVPLERVTALTPGREYLVTLTLTWRGRNKHPIGTSVTQLIRAVRALSYDRVESGGEVVELADVQAHREFWHKAWQGGFSAQRRKVVFDLKYVYAFDPATERNAQMETQTELDQSTETHQEGRLRSGLVLSAYALNRLLGSLGRSPTLDEPELAALRDPEFADRFSAAARVKVALRGRPGDSAAIWVFPTVRLVPVVLQQAATITPGGQVTRFEEHRVTVPLPVSAHIIGGVTP